MYNRGYLNTNTPQLLITVGRVLTKVRTVTMATSDYTSNTPYGYCHCGCGKKTNILQFSNKRTGAIKGQPSKFLSGHSQRIKQTTPEDVFWSHVAIGADDQCWLWTGGCDSSGYGTKNWNGNTISAHRLAWQLKNGAIPVGLKVLHTCDNPKCCNPKHLWIGTDKDNAVDRMLKGRNRKQSGEESSFHKLTFAQVKAIREQYTSGETTIKRLSLEYHISETQVGRIIHNVSWRI